MAAGTSTPQEAGQGPSVLSIAANIGAKIRDAAEDAKEEREKAAEKGETPEKGSLFKSALGNKFNPIKSKKAKSKWADQFSWNKKTESDQSVKPPTDGGGGGGGGAKLKEFIASGFTGILKDTGLMTTKLSGVQSIAAENLGEVTRASSTLTVIKDSINAQTELRRKALEEAKFARAEKQLEKTTDTAGVSESKSADKEEGEGNGGGGNGPLDWILDALGISDIASNFIPGGKKNPLSRLNPFQKPTVTQGAGGKPPGPRMPGTSPRVTTSGGVPAPRSPGGFKLPKLPGLPKGMRGGPSILAPLFAGFEFAGRKSDGQTNTQAAVGTGASTLGGVGGAMAGGKTGALAGAAIGALFGGVGAAPGAVIGGILGSLAGGFGGSMLAGGAADKLTGVENQSSGGIVPLSRGGIAPGLYDNPTKGMLSPGQSVIPLNRSAGKEMLDNSGKKLSGTTPEDTAMDTVGAMILGVSSGMLGSTDSGSVGDQVKQNIRKAAKEFGISNLTFTSPLGNAQFGKVDPGKSAKDFLAKIFDSITIFGSGKSGGGGGNKKPPNGDPTGPISQAPQGNETDIQSIQGNAGAPIDLSQNTDVATGTGLHHGREDMRDGLRVRDYFIGGNSGPSDGIDGLGAKLYTPLGFGSTIYKANGDHGINFLDPSTKQIVGHYQHVINPQHQLDGQTIGPGTVVGTQGGLPGTPSALGSSTSVHLHVEGTDAFHQAVIRTYADGNLMKQQVGGHSAGSNAKALPGARTNLPDPTVSKVPGAANGMFGMFKGPSQNTEIAATYGEGFPKTPNWMKQIEADYQRTKNNPFSPGTPKSGRGMGDTWGGPVRGAQDGGVIDMQSGGITPRMTAAQALLRAQKKKESGRATQQRTRLGVQKVNGKWVNMGVSDQAVGRLPWWHILNKKGATQERKVKQEKLAIALAAKLNKQEGLDKPKPSPPPIRRQLPSGTQERTRPTSQSSSSSSVAAVLPAAAPPVSNSSAEGSFGSVVPDGKTKALIFADFLYLDLV